MSFSKKCPYCNQFATITDSDKDSVQSSFNVKTFEGIKYIHAFMIVCPNEKCKKYTLEIYFSNAIKKSSGQYGYNLDYDNAQKWNLIPASNAKGF